MTDVAIIRSLGGLVFDATFKEDHEVSSTVTDNPIETGVSVSDHMYQNPTKYTLNAAVSNAAVHGEDTFVSNVSRVAEAYKQLRALKDAAEPFDIQTGLTLYNNMVCLSIKVTQDKDTSQVLDFTAELREVIIVSTETVSYTPRKGATKRQAGKVTDKGEQQGQEPKPQKQSLLKKLTGSFQ